MLTKTDVRDVLRDALLFIRKLSQDTQDTKNLQQIHVLADIVHNTPTLLYEWDTLESDDSQKLEFLTMTLEWELQDYSSQYVDSPYQFVKSNS